jgi:hypothetical protein
MLILMKYMLSNLSAGKQSQYIWSDVLFKMAAAVWEEQTGEFSVPFIFFPYVLFSSTATFLFYLEEPWLDH